MNRDHNISRLNASAACITPFGTPTGNPASSVTSPFGTPRSARPLQRAFSSTHVGDVSVFPAKLSVQTQCILSYPNQSYLFQVVSPQHTPQRSISFVSRAMDYVFNWWSKQKLSIPPRFLFEVTQIDIKDRGSHCRPCYIWQTYAPSINVIFKILVLFIFYHAVINFLYWMYHYRQWVHIIY